MRLRFVVDEAGSEARWTVEERFAGFPGVLHGGMVLAMMDDAMWYAVYARGGVTLTAEATVRDRRRVEVGAPVIVRGEVQAQRARLWSCRAEVLDAGTGEAIAVADAKFLGVPRSDIAGLIGESRVHELPSE